MCSSKIRFSWIFCALVGAALVVWAADQPADSSGGASGAKTMGSCSQYLTAALSGSQRLRPLIDAGNWDQAKQQAADVGNQISMAQSAGGMAASNYTVNTHCPIDNTALTTAAGTCPTMRYCNGQRVGFSCEANAQTWDRLSAADKNAKLCKAMTPVNTCDPIDRTTLKSGQCPDTQTRMCNGRKIGFASEENARTWDAMPEAQKQQTACAAASAQEMQASAGQPVAYNQKDPLTHDAIDATRLTDAQTRYYCHVIAFASEENARKWDAMTDAEKEGKLKAAAGQNAAAAPAMGSAMPEGWKVVNSRSPLDGAAFDPKTIPDAQIRTFEGHKIGFASAEQAQQWDGLSADQQRMKFRQVAPDSAAVMRSGACAEHAKMAMQTCQELKTAIDAQDKARSLEKLDMLQTQLKGAYLAHGGQAFNRRDLLSDESVAATPPDARMRSYCYLLGFASEENARKWDALTDAEPAQKLQNLAMMRSGTQTPCAAIPAGTCPPAASVCNVRCPVTGQAMGAAPAASRTWRGYNIGFSSQEAASKWDAMDESQKESHLRGAGVPVPANARP